MHLKIHYVLLLQDILLPCEAQIIGYHGKGVGRRQLLNSVTYSSPGMVVGQLGILKHWFLSQKCNSTYVVVQAQHRILIPGFLERVMLWTDSEMRLNFLM